MNIAIFANGPGEVYERAIPFALFLKNSFNDPNIILILTPCQFSSGSEYDVARDSSLFNEIFRLRKFISLYKYLIHIKIDIIFHLGGDLFYPTIFSTLLGVSLYSYTTFFSFKPFVKLFLLPYSKKAKRNIPLYKSLFIGNLSFDRKKKKRKGIYKKGKANKKYKVGIFPGSRKIQFEHLLPFFIKILENLSSFIDIDSYLFLSPFITFDFLENVLLKGPTYNVLDYSLGKIVAKDNGFYILSKEGLYISIKTKHEDIGILDFAITTPGTSTLTLTYYGVPMFVVSPLNKLEIIPLNGIINFIDVFPYIGPIFKRKIVAYVLKRRPYFALPNIIEDRKIVQEIRGVLTSSSVAVTIEKEFLSKKKLYNMKRVLIDFKNKYVFRKFKLKEMILKDE